MSGIVGIVNFDGAPLDRALLSRMTASLDFRGPDARRIWVDERGRGSGTNQPGDFSPCVGFGHTLLRTSYEAEHEQQPFTLDGNTWIVADCRIDAREELIATLRAKGRNASLQRPDVELILHAWHVWGEECVEHLLGDFAFAIWDAPRRRLFCARDHMGVKPFYYAHVGSTMIFSNTLDCVRLSSTISSELNDQAVGDFLATGLNQNPGTTFFSNIRRVPPAHTLIASCGELTINRYWTLPIEEPLFYKRAEDYVTHFLDLLRKAVTDRMPSGTLGIFMSGGLDSTALAAIAADVRKAGSKPAPVAFTSVYDYLIPDQERRFASMTADYLGIPIQYHVRDDDPLGWEQGATPIRTPEPVANPLPLRAREKYNTETASYTRVCLYGEGPDNALRYEWRPYVSSLIEKRKWARLLRDLARHTITYRSLPGLTGVLRPWKTQQPASPLSSFPEWLEPDFASRLHLREQEKQLQHTDGSLHPVRPHAHHSLTNVIWAISHEGLDAGHTRVPIEVRHPFLDLRVLRFLLQIPVIPWCRQKHLLRVALRGSLPEPVRRRSKTPLQGFPEFERARLSGLPQLVAHPSVLRYVDWKRLPHKISTSPQEFDLNLRAIGLNYWLHGVQN